MSEVEKMWKILKEYGITNEEEFRKALKENPLNIGVFTIDNHTTNRKKIVNE